MATIKDIAQKAGVSIGTVDRVLHNRGIVSEKTRKRILDIMDELNYHPNLVAKGLAVCKKRLKLCFVLMNPAEHMFFTDVEIAAKRKAKELEQYGVQVIIKYINRSQINMRDSDTDVPVKLRELEEYDGLAVLGVPSPFVEGIIEKANEIQLPVVCYNVEPSRGKYLSYIGCDYVKAGRLAAGLCALAGGGRSNVCVFSEDVTHGSLSQSYFERMRGFCREAKERYPEMKLLDVQEFGIDKTENYELAERMLQKYPEVNVVYVVNTGNYNICEAIAKADVKHQVQIITNDLVGEQREMVRRGIISATICQEPEKQGEMPLDILFQYLAYNTVPENKIFHTDLSVVLAQNL